MTNVFYGLVQSKCYRVLASVELIYIYLTRGVQTVFIQLVFFPARANMSNMSEYMYGKVMAWILICSFGTKTQILNYSQGNILNQWSLSYRPGPHWGETVKGGARREEICR